jgi:hypothetical protein
VQVRKRTLQDDVAFNSFRRRVSYTTVRQENGQAHSIALARKPNTLTGKRVAASMRSGIHSGTAAEGQVLVVIQNLTAGHVPAVWAAPEHARCKVRPNAANPLERPSATYRRPSAGAFLRGRPCGGSSATIRSRSPPPSATRSHPDRQDAEGRSTWARSIVDRLHNSAQRVHALCPVARAPPSRGRGPPTSRA